MKVKMLRVLEDAGREALRIRVLGELGTEEKSSPQDIVTRADQLVEEVLVAYITAQFPDDGIAGEEGAARETRNGKVWYFDPIDGTTNYAAGSDFFGISAGRFDERGAPEVGMLHFPALGGLSFYAARGNGAFVGSTRGRFRFERILTPSFGGGLSEALVAVGLTSDRNHIFGPLRAKTRNLVAYGSFVFEAMLVAQGKLAAYVHTGATIFDVAAAITICREAGCLVVGIHDDQLDLTARRIPIMIVRSERLASELRTVMTAT